VLRSLRRTLALVLLLAGVVAELALLGAAMPRPFALSDATTDEPSRTRRILLLAGPIHTDLALPADADVLEAFAFLEGTGLPYRDPAVRWLALGWGGREFYVHTPTWDQLQALPAFWGLTLDDSAMHVQLVGAIDTPHPSVLALDLRPEQFDAVLKASLAGFRRNEDGRPIHMPGISHNAYDAFYEAEGRFTALLGCNTWASAAIRAGGLRTGWWNPLPQSLFWSIRRFNILDPVSNAGIGAAADPPPPVGEGDHAERVVGAPVDRHVDGISDPQTFFAARSGT
jgi:uncharacterized protein (TIGR02117 family)